MQLLQWFGKRFLFPNKEKILKIQQEAWEAKWGSDDFSPIWAGRGVAPEIIEAEQTGWLPKTGRVLDIGCGKGVITAWFAARGYEALGIDIADSAVKQARLAHPSYGSNLEFRTLDPCQEPPPARSYHIVVDRGCLHEIPRALISDFIRNISSVCAEDARMMLFMKISRKSLLPEHAEAETAAHVQWVRDIFSGQFKVEKYTTTSLAPDHRPKSESPMPGLLYWLRRLPKADRR